MDRQVSKLCGWFVARYVQEMPTRRKLAIEVYAPRYDDERQARLEELKEADTVVFEYVLFTLCWKRIECCGDSPGSPVVCRRHAVVSGAVPRDFKDRY